MIFLSPSYRRDLSRILLLRETMARFYTGDAEHFVLVPREDLSLFRSALGSGNVSVLCQQDFVAPAYYPNGLYRWVEKLAPGQRWRFKRMAGRPGWIVQQIVKLSAPEISSDEDVVVLDSDVLFIKEFADEQFVPAREKLLVRLSPGEEDALQREHISQSRDTLRLAAGPTDFHYMAWPAILHRTWLLELHAYLERTCGRAWQTVLRDLPTLSEYSLYGIFVEEFLRPADLRVRSVPYHRGVWVSDSFEQSVSSAVSSARSEPETICVVIQSNLEIHPEEYGDLVRRCLRAPAYA